MITLREFLDSSYTCYHAARIGAKMLADAGFAELGAKCASKPAGYYKVCGGSLFAAKTGAEKPNIVLSHTDSPCLRITGAGEITLNTEKYGGGLLRSYLDRRMKIAGVVVEKKGDTFSYRCIESDFDVIIPSLAVHLGAGKEGESLSVSRDMLPLTGRLADAMKPYKRSDCYAADLYCVPSEKSYVCGAHGEYLCSPRIDNLVSVYSSLRALIECDNSSTAVAACFNNEETGSETREGAKSVLLKSFLSEVLAAEKKSADVNKLLCESLIISCDGAHAMHPAHREAYVDNAPVLGGGVVIKYNDRYATDPMSGAAIASVFESAGVSVQNYRHSPDMRCGSTVGLTAAHTLGCKVCDIGLPQLAMHSAVETAAVCDAEALLKGLTAYYSSDITVAGDTVKVK